MKKGILSFLLLLWGGVIIGVAQKDDLALEGRLKPLSKDNILKTEGYHNWGPSIIKGDDGKYHLFYSRWAGAHSVWLTFSEIAHAVSDNPSGPWEYKETVLKGRGKGYWDAITAHNPKIKFFEGKYYLYYISTNMGDEEYTKEDLDEIGQTGYSHPKWKVLRNNQRTGVAVANSINGPWKRFDKPIIEPSGPITTITVNPGIDKGPDGKYYLIVKGDKPNETRFIRNQAIAISDSPIGPFKMQPKPVIGNLDTEDMSLWYDENRAYFYGIFHAHTFIGLVSSPDGINWGKATNYKVTDKVIPLKDGGVLKPNRLERPFVYVEKGDPKSLGLAMTEGHESYIIFIPIECEK